MTTKATPTAKGVISLTLRCTGNALARCRGSVYIGIGNKIAGSAKFSILSGRRLPLQIKLSKSCMTLLRKKKHVAVDATLTYPDGLQDVEIATGAVRLTAPKVVRHKAAPKKRG